MWGWPIRRPCRWPRAPLPPCSLGGMPEGRIILAEAALYVAKAPKSNSAYLAIDNALAQARAGSIGPVPNHLKDSHYAGAQKLGHGVKATSIPTTRPAAGCPQQYLPDNLKDAVFYEENPRDYKGFQKEAEQ